MTFGCDERLIQAVGPRDGWVLERLGRRLATKLPYPVFLIDQPDRTIGKALTASRPFRWASITIASEQHQIVTEIIGASSPLVAFGPELPEWGSWQWAGGDFRDELAKYFRTVAFSGDQIPECDIVVFIKHAPPLDLMAQASRRSTLIYCPIDYYGSVAHIDADSSMLRRCARILVHCERLRKYFEPYAPVEYIDHHVKFAAPLERRGQEPFGQKSGVRGQKSEIGSYVLWVGVRTNPPYPQEE